MDTNHPTYNKIDNTFERVMNEINKFEKVFKQGGQLEMAVMEIDGDPSYLKDVAQALSSLYDALEDAHFGTIGHVVDDRGAKESVQENKKTIKEGVLDSDDEDGFMARSQLYFMARDAIKLHSVIQDQDDLEPWVQDKIASSSKDMDAVRRYTEYNAMKSEIEPEGMELSTHTHDEPVEEIPAEIPAEVAIETDVVETDYARDYVKAHAHDRMKDLHPVSRNAFLVDLEKTYPGIRKELGEDVVEEKEEVKESMEFDDKNASDELQVVAKDLFKSAMKAAQKKHKESKVLEGVTISGGVPGTGSATLKAKDKADVQTPKAKAKADAQNAASDEKLIKKAVNRKRNYNDDGIAPPKGHHNTTSNRWAESTEAEVKS
jgi:hypothetical protein